jgi:hypothetical protein
VTDGVVNVGGSGGAPSAGTPNAGTKGVVEAGFEAGLDGEATDGTGVAGFCGGAPGASGTRGWDDTGVDCGVVSTAVR